MARAFDWLDERANSGPGPVLTAAFVILSLLTIAQWEPFHQAAPVILAVSQELIYAILTVGKV